MMMDPIQLIEIACAVLILGAGIFVYRRKPAKDAGDGQRHYDTQGAVVLFVIAVIIAIHGLGWMQYHPSASELETYEGLKSVTSH